MIKVAGSGRITKRNRRFLRVASGGMGNNASHSSVRLAPSPTTPLETPSLSSPPSDPDHTPRFVPQLPPLPLSSDQPSSPPLPSTTPNELPERVNESGFPLVLRRSSRNRRPARELDPASGQWVARGMNL